MRATNRRTAAARALAVLLAPAVLLLASASASAAAWLPPADLSAPGKDAIDPRVAMAASGETVVIWEREGKDPFSNTIQASTRSPGGQFSTPIDLSLPSQDPVLVMTPGGEAIAAWWHSATPNYILQVSFRQPGGSFSPPADVETIPSGSSPPTIRLAVNGSGQAVLAHTVRVVPEPTQEEEENEETPDPVNAITASYRNAGGGFSTPEIVSPEPFESGVFASAPDVAIDAAGDAIVAWAYGNAAVVPPPPDPPTEPERSIEAALRPAGSGGFGSPELVSDGDGHAAAPSLAMDASGDAVAAWTERDEGEDSIVRAAHRPDGGGFEAPEELSQPGEDASAPQAAMSPAGAATVVWPRPSGTEFYIQATERPAGGDFEFPPDDLTPQGESSPPSPPRIAVNAGNGAVVTWSGSTDSGTPIVMTAVRPAGGSFSTPEGISQGGPGFFHPEVAIDGGGNATVAWYRSNGVNEIVQVAGYDAAPPEMRGVSIPATGTVGVPVAFSASPFDVWPIASTSFSFGDGGAAAGTAVSHTYAAPGTYPVTATAVDAAGTPVSAGATIRISPSYEFRLGKQKRNKKKGTVLLSIEVPGPGSVVVSGKLVKRKQKRAARAGTVRLSVAAKGKALKALRKKGKSKVGARITFTPDGGDGGASRKVKLVFVKKKS